MKRVLLITSFPPLRNPRSTQAARFVKFLPQYGWEPWVVCRAGSRPGSGPIDTGLLRLVPPDTTVLRVKSLEPKVLLALAAKFVPFLLNLPDSNAGWYRPAYKKCLSLLKEKHFDLILSCASPPTNNLVGLKLKRETGLPWIAFFSDLWVDRVFNKYGRLASAINRRMEEEVVQRADGIIFVSEGLRQLMMKKYPQQWRNKTFVIPQCYDPELVSSLENCSKELQNSKFTITYVGSFYYLESLTPFFQAISHILNKHPDIYQSMAIQMVGKARDEEKRLVTELGIDKVVSVAGNVPYLESLEYMAGADILLLINSPSPVSSIFHSSKVAEYLGFKKPILAITPLDSGWVPVIRQIRGGIVVSPEDTDGIDQAIITFYQDYRQGNLSKYSYDDEDIKAYNAINTVKNLAQLFDEVESEAKLT